MIGPVKTVISSWMAKKKNSHTLSMKKKKTTNLSIKFVASVCPKMDSMNEMSASTRRRGRSMRVMDPNRQTWLQSMCFSYMDSANGHYITYGFCAQFIVLWMNLYVCAPLIIISREDRSQSWLFPRDLLCPSTRTEHSYHALFYIIMARRNVYFERPIIIDWHFRLLSSLDIIHGGGIIERKRKCFDRFSSVASLIPKLHNRGLCPSYEFTRLQQFSVDQIFDFSGNSL